MERGDEARDLTISLRRHASNVVAIVRAVVDEVEDLLDRAELPSVDALRPGACPLCGKPAHAPGEPLGLVGHGTYRRQVLGVLGAGVEAVTAVRRYRCRGCGHTSSVLAAELHPRRWYAAGAILEALRLHLLEGQSEREIRRRFAAGDSAEGWRSLRRWRRELLALLWAWLAKRLGRAGASFAATREEGLLRLRRLLAEAGPESAADPWAIVRALGGATVHAAGHVWPLGRDPPGALRALLRSE